MLLRRVVGDQRLVSLEAAQVLGDLYGTLRLFTNLVQPSFKLKSSERDGGKIKHRHPPPRTPLQRRLATGQVSQEREDPLRALQRQSDPLRLLDTIRRCQGQLAVLASTEQEAGLGGNSDVMCQATSWIEQRRVGRWRCFVAICRRCGSPASHAAAKLVHETGKGRGRIPLRPAWR